MQSLPDKMIADLPPDLLSRIPYTILLSLREHIVTNTTTDHDILEAEARTISLSRGDDVLGYVEKHKNVRTKMLNTEYPSITSERFTVKFLVQGIKSRPSLAQLAVLLAAQPPATIRDFTNQILQALFIQRPMQDFFLAHGGPPPIGTYRRSPSGPAYHSGLAIPVPCHQQQRRGAYHSAQFQQNRRGAHSNRGSRTRAVTIHPRPQGHTGPWCKLHGWVTHTNE